MLAHKAHWKGLACFRVHEFLPSGVEGFCFVHWDREVEVDPRLCIEVEANDGQKTELDDFFHVDEFLRV